MASSSGATLAAVFFLALALCPSPSSSFPLPPREEWGRPAADFRFRSVRSTTFFGDDDGWGEEADAWNDDPWGRRQEGERLAEQLRWFFTSFPASPTRRLMSVLRRHRVPFARVAPGVPEVGLVLEGADGMVRAEGENSLPCPEVPKDERPEEGLAVKSVMIIILQSIGSR